MGFEWSFRFKSQAGEAWTQDDPWHQGRPARRAFFRLDRGALEGDNGEGGGAEAPREEVGGDVHFVDEADGLLFRISWRFLARTPSPPGRRAPQCPNATAS